MCVSALVAIHCVMMYVQNYVLYDGCVLCVFKYNWVCVWMIVVYCLMRCALCYTIAFVCVVCCVLYDDVRVVVLRFVGVWLRLCVCF